MVEENQFLHVFLCPAQVYCGIHVIFPPTPHICAYLHKIDKIANIDASDIKESLEVQCHFNKVSKLRDECVVQ